jgi:hypothetical protein
MNDDEVKALLEGANDDGVWLLRWSSTSGLIEALREAAERQDTPRDRLLLHTAATRLERVLQIEMAPLIARMVQETLDATQPIDTFEEEDDDR